MTLADAGEASLIRDRQNGLCITHHITVYSRCFDTTYVHPTWGGDNGNEGGSFQSTHPHPTNWHILALDKGNLATQHFEFDGNYYHQPLGVMTKGHSLLISYKMRSTHAGFLIWTLHSWWSLKPGTYHWQKYRGGALHSAPSTTD